VDLVSYELRPCGHLAAEGSAHACPLEGEVLPRLKTGPELYAEAAALDPWPEIPTVIEHEVDEHPPRWRCPSCGNVRSTGESTTAVYCTGDPSRARRHGLTPCELER
jgi:hypothetical protein